jgi:hypothetical protein
MNQLIDPATRVVVATMQPLQDFHRPTGDTIGDRTACGRPTGGWYELSAGMAYNNVDSPCGFCFPLGREPGTIVPGFSGPGF